MTSYGQVERTLPIPGNCPKKPVVVSSFVQRGDTAAPARVCFGPHAMHDNGIEPGNYRNVAP